ncbi:MAG: DUF5694 domain-containing protein [Chryseolinea sp.]
MFRLLLALIFLLNTTLSISQQKILLIGTRHRTLPDRVEEIIPIGEAVEHFQPEIICVEYRISTDTASLKNSYTDERFNVIEAMRKDWNIPSGNISDKIKLLANSPDLQSDIMKRMELHNLYFVSPDFANADYQFYLLMLSLNGNSSRRLLLSERFPHFEEIESRHALKIDRNNEYTSLVFPLAAKLNISYLYPIDDMSSWKKYEKYFEILEKRDATLANRKKYYQRLDDFDKKFKGLSKENNEWVFGNTPEIINELLYVAAYKVDKTSSEEINMLSYYWIERNKKMAQHIHEVATLQPKKNIVVFFGASHVGAVREELNKLKGSYKVLTLSDVLSKHE